MNVPALLAAAAGTTPAGSAAEPGPGGFLATLATALGTTPDALAALGESGGATTPSGLGELVARLQASGTSLADGPAPATPPGELAAEQEPADPAAAVAAALAAWRAAPTGTLGASVAAAATGTTAAEAAPAGPGTRVPGATASGQGTVVGPGHDTATPVPSAPDRTGAAASAEAAATGATTATTATTNTPAEDTTAAPSPTDAAKPAGHTARTEAAPRRPAPSPDPAAAADVPTADTAPAEAPDMATPVDAAGRAPATAQSRDGLAAGSRQAAAVDRIMRAVEHLENAPPPRQLSFEVDGVRMTVALRGDGVAVDVQAGRDLLASSWQRDLQSALNARGFDLASGRGDGRGQPESGHRGRDASPGAAPRGAMTDRPAPTTTRSADDAGLRL